MADDEIEKNINNPTEIIKIEGEFDKIKYDPWGEFFLDPNCPVVCLGTSPDNHIYYYFNPDGKMILMDAKSHNKQNLYSLFGTQSLYLIQRYPVVSKTIKDQNGNIIELIYSKDRFANDIIVRQLIHACNAKGIFDPTDRVRGCGMWQHKGFLANHCGDSVQQFQNDSALPPILFENAGVIDGYVYRSSNRRRQLVHPVDRAEFEKQAAYLLDILRSWNWSAPLLDPWLFLGGLIGAYFGGALDWRSAMWITGQTAVGKTTLLSFCKAFLNDECIKAENATLAAVRNECAGTTLPVLLDEQRGNDKDRMEDMLALMRVASQGGRGTRATPTQGVNSFDIRSTMIFFGINAPVLENQDANRLTMFKLNRLDDDKRGEAFDTAKVKHASCIVLSYLAANFDEFKKRMQRVRQFMAENYTKLDSRALDQLQAPATFGLLASDIKDDWDDDCLRHALGEISAAHRSHYDELDWKRVIRYLLGKVIDFYYYEEYNAFDDKARRHTKATVGSIIEAAYEEVKSDPTQYITHTNQPANFALKENGMLVYKDNLGNYRLFVSQSHPGIYALMRGSDWESPPGRGRGLWHQALIDAPMCEAIRKVLGGGITSRGDGIRILDFTNLQTQTNLDINEKITDDSTEQS